MNSNSSSANASRRQSGSAPHTTKARSSACGTLASQEEETEKHEQLSRLHRTCEDVGSTGTSSPHLGDAPGGDSRRRSPQRGLPNISSAPPSSTPASRNPARWLAPTSPDPTRPIALPPLQASHSPNSEIAEGRVVPAHHGMRAGEGPSESKVSTTSAHTSAGWHARWWLQGHPAKEAAPSSSAVPAILPLTDTAIADLARAVSPTDAATSPPPPQQRAGVPDEGGATPGEGDSSGTQQQPRGLRDGPHGNTASSILLAAGANSCDSTPNRKVRRRRSDVSAGQAGAAGFPEERKRSSGGAATARDRLSPMSRSASYLTGPSSSRLVVGREGGGGGGAIGNPGGSALITPRHGRRPSVSSATGAPPLASALGVVGLAGFTNRNTVASVGSNVGGSHARVGNGVGSTSLHTNASQGSCRTVSMHSLATRQRNDDNFDFGFDALGIPANELRSSTSRGGFNSSSNNSGFGGGPSSLHSSLALFHPASPSPPPPLHSSSNNTTSDLADTPPAAVAATGSRGSRSGVGFANSGNSTRRRHRGRATPRRDGGGVIVDAHEQSSRSTLGSSGDSGANANPHAPSTHEGKDIDRLRGAKGAAENSPITNANLDGAEATAALPPALSPDAHPSPSLSPTAQHRAGLLVSPEKCPAPARALVVRDSGEEQGSRGNAEGTVGRDSGAAGHYANMSLLRATTLAARRIDAEDSDDTDYDLSRTSDGGSARNGGGGASPPHAVALASPVAGWGLGDGVLPTPQRTRGAEDSYRRLFGLDKINDDDDVDVVTAACDSASNESSVSSMALQRSDGRDADTFLTTRSGGSSSDDDVGSSNGSSTGGAYSVLADISISAITTTTTTPTRKIRKAARRAGGRNEGKHSGSGLRKPSGRQFFSSDLIGDGISAYFPLASASVSRSAGADSSGSAKGVSGAGSGGGWATAGFPLTSYTGYLYGYGSVHSIPSTYSRQAGSASGEGGLPLEQVPSTFLLGEGQQEEAQQHHSFPPSRVLSMDSLPLASVLRQPLPAEGAEGLTPTRSLHSVGFGSLVLAMDPEDTVVSQQHTKGSPVEPSAKTKPTAGPPEPQQYVDESGRVLDGVTLWVKPVTRRRLQPTTPATDASPAWELARGYVLLEKNVYQATRQTSRYRLAGTSSGGGTGVAAQSLPAPESDPLQRRVSFLAPEPCVSFDGHQVLARVGGLLGNCTVDECVCRVQGCGELPSRLLADLQGRFAARGENAFVVVMDRVSRLRPKPPATEAKSTASEAAPTWLLSSIAGGVVQAVLDANNRESGAAVDLRLAMAFVPCRGQGAAGRGTEPVADVRDGGLCFVDLVDSGPCATSAEEEGGTTRAPPPTLEQALEVAASPVFGPCINGCQWLLVESQSNVRGALEHSLDTLARCFSETKRSTSDGIFWMQFLLQKRSRDDVVVSSFSVASAPSAAVFESVLDQRAESPWPLFRYALGKGPCSLVAVAALREDDTEAAAPLAIMQRVLQTPHPPAKPGSIAQYVATLRGQLAELERARDHVSATGRDVKRFTVRLAKLRANMQDAEAYLRGAEDSNVPIYVDAGKATRGDRGRSSTDSGGDGALDPSAASGSPATRYRLAPAPVTGIALSPPPPLPPADAEASSFHWQEESSSLRVRNAAPSAAESFPLLEYVRLPSTDDSPALSSASLATLEDEFRNGFNSFGVFVCPDEASSPATLAVSVSFVTAVVRDILAHREAAKARREALAPGGGPHRDAPRHSSCLRDEGTVLRLSASMYAVRGDFVVDLLVPGPDENGGDNAGKVGDDSAVSSSPYTPPPMELLLVRSPLLGLSPCGVMQRNITNADAFDRLLTVGQRRFRAIATPQPPPPPTSTAAPPPPPPPLLLLLSLQLKQQGPATRDVVVSSLSVLVLGAQHHLLSDCLPSRVAPGDGGGGAAAAASHNSSRAGQRRRGRPRVAPTTTASAPGTVVGDEATGRPYARLHTIVQDAVKGAGHCVCAAVLEERTPSAAYAESVSGLLRSVCRLCRRATSQQVQQGSVARLLLRLRRMRPKAQRINDRLRSRRNTERVDKLMYDAEQLLYHPDEQDPKYYARTTERRSRTGEGQSRRLSSSSAARRASRPVPPVPHLRTADGSTVVTVEVAEDDDDLYGGDRDAPRRASGSRRNGSGAVSPQTPTPILAPSTVRRQEGSPSHHRGTATNGHTARAATTTAAHRDGEEGQSRPSSPSPRNDRSGHYYGLHFDRDPPLLMPQRPLKAHQRQHHGMGATAPRQLHIPALVVVGAPASDESAGGGRLVRVRDQHLVELCEEKATLSSALATTPSLCFEADEVAEIRTASSSIKSVTLARVLSCVVSGRTAALVMRDTEAVACPHSVSWLLVRTAVAALFTSLADTGNPFTVSVRAVSFHKSRPIAVDLLRHMLGEESPGALLEQARCGAARAHTPHPPSVPQQPPSQPQPNSPPHPLQTGDDRCATTTGSGSSSGGGRPSVEGTSASPMKPVCDTAPFLSKLCFSPLCGPGYNTATSLPVPSSELFDVILRNALAFSSTFDAVAAGAAHDGQTTAASDSESGVAVQVAVHQYIPAHEDVVISSLWCVNSGHSLAAARADIPADGTNTTTTTTTNDPLSNHFLPFFIGGPCYTAAVLGFTQAPAPAAFTAFGAEVRGLQAVGLMRPRVGSVAAYEEYLQAKLERARAASTAAALPGRTGSPRSASNRNGDSRACPVDEEKNVAVPRLTAMVNECRTLRQRTAAASFEHTSRVPGLLAHEPKFFHAFDEF